MAALLVFWGGAENGFNAFSHCPEEYASHIQCKTLLMYGAKDDKVSLQETETIYKRLPMPSRLIIYPEAGHENYLNKYRKEWTEDIQAFLSKK